MRFIVLTVAFWVLFAECAQGQRKCDASFLRYYQYYSFEYKYKLIQMLNIRIYCTSCTSNKIEHVVSKKTIESTNKAYTADVGGF